MSDVPAQMDAWVVDRPGPMSTGPLIRIRRDVPAPAAGEVLVRVRVCAVCRTDLHLAEGDLLPRRRLTTPGHEVVGTVAALGPGATRFAVGDRIGIAWLRGTCGTCDLCRAGRENLCRARASSGSGRCAWRTYRRVVASACTGSVPRRT
jgi:propanol-preferring alcohol dehydrogenase